MTGRPEEPGPESRPESRPGSRPRSAPESAAERKRRLDRIFGEVLPEQTSDDAPEPGGNDAAEEWLRRQVPPHHG